MDSLSTNHWILLAFFGFWGLVAIGILAFVGSIFWRQHRRERQRRLKAHERRRLAAPGNRRPTLH